MADGGYIGYAGASSTEVSVVADIAESLDISGFTPSISVSSMPALAVSSMVTATPMAVSGTVVTTAPLNQNVSGISLDAIKVATETIQDLQTNVIDSNNSTTATLAGGATWTGTGTDVLKYAVVATSIKASHDSATDGFAIEFSPDNSNWDESTTFNLEAGVTRRYQFPVTARYYRVTLTNGGSAQSYLRVQTILHADMIPGSIHKVDNGTEKGDRTCQLVKAVLQAKKPNGEFINIDATNSGNLKVSVEEVEDVIFPVSGTSLDSIQTATEGVLADTALMVPDLDAIRIDTAANEVLLTGIDTVLDNILTKNTEIDTALDTIDGVLDSSLTKQTEIDAVLDTIKTDTGTIDTVLDNILTKNTEIDTALDTIDAVLDSSLTKQTEIDAVLDNILTKNTEIDAVLDTIKVDTEAIETAVELLDNAISGNEMQVDVVSMPTTTVTGAVAVSFPATTGITGGGAESGSQRVTIANDSTGSVGIKPSTSSYLSHVYIDLDATGDNPATNTEVIAAPGSGNKLVIYGVQGSIVGSAAAAAGNWYLSDGNTSAATTLWTGRAQGVTNTHV